MPSYGPMSENGPQNAVLEAKRPINRKTDFTKKIIKSKRLINRKIT
jgi:hypothetical protein